MAAQSGSIRLILSMAFSLLAHLIVLFLLSWLLRFYAATHPEKITSNLEVRLMPFSSPTKPHKRLLATPAAAGVSLPNEVAIPWQAQTGSAPFSAHLAQQNAARSYYQQAMAAQARQQSELKAQLIMLQLQQLLAKRFDLQSGITGKCKLAEIGQGENNHLVCDTPAMREALHQDEKMVAEMLITLRGMGKMLNGFSVNQFGITLIDEE